MADFRLRVELVIATTKPEVGRGAKFTASVLQWLKNSYTWFQASGYYNLKVMRN